MEDDSAITIQKRWRGYIARQQWHIYIDDIDAEWNDCTHNFRKHLLRRGSTSNDEYYCDWCEEDCNRIRYFCTAGCNFDLCESCGETEPYPERLLLYVTFDI